MGINDEISRGGVFLPENIVILIVASSDFEKKILQSILSSRWNVITASSGKECFRLFDSGLVPSLVVVSAGLNGEIDVYEVLKNVSFDPFREDTPVVVAASDISREEELRLLRAGIVDLVKLPCDEGVIIQRVDNALYNSWINNYIAGEANRAATELESQHRHYRRFTYQMLTTLAYTIDRKDEYTQGHSSRVAIYSTHIGRAMDLNSLEMEQLFHGALMHDVGKIGVADSILRKPGRLTEDEFRVMREHSVIGYEILKNVTLMPEVGQVARWHHERYDGRGYPDGLRGDEIPFLARIVTVADSFDAITSTRSYRQARAPQAAMREILNNKGSQFDPAIADAAISLIEDGTLMDLEPDYDYERGSMFLNVHEQDSSTLNGNDGQD